MQPLAICIALNLVLVLSFFGGTAWLKDGPAVFDGLRQKVVGFAIVMTLAILALTIDGQLQLALDSHVGLRPFKMQTGLAALFLACVCFPGVVGRGDLRELMGEDRVRRLGILALATQLVLTACF